MNDFSRAARLGSCVARGDSPGGARNSMPRLPAAAGRPRGPAAVPRPEILPT